MDNITISERDALALCQKVEDHFFEKKAANIKPNKIERIAVAFANSEGGQILIGIKDGSGKNASLENWQGVESPEYFNDILQSLYNLSPPLNMIPQFLLCKNKAGYVLQLTIEKSASIHKTADDKVFVRQGAGCLPVTSPEKINALSYSRGTSSYEDSIVKNDTLLDRLTETVEIKDFTRNLEPQQDALNFFINQQLIDTKTWDPKVAPILLFADNPSTELSSTRCGIKIVRYATKEDEPERDHLQETYTIEGTLYKQINDSAAKVQEILSDAKIWTSEGRKAVQYPPETLWEVIVNAVIHRDYSISDDIQIHIYDNRVVVSSPGKLPGIINLENILDERFSRNPKLVRTLARYKNPPNKDLGEGLNTAFQKMKDWKLKEPIIEEKGNRVIVTVNHTPLARPEELVLTYLENHESITNKQAREITGIKDTNVMKSVFKKLQDNNELEQVPGKGGAASAWRKPVHN